MPKSLNALAALLLVLGACDQLPDEAPAEAGGDVVAVERAPIVPPDAPLPPGAEARSLLGQPLSRPPLPNLLRAQRESELEASEAALANNPNSADALIWVGRRQAYLGRYQQALQTFRRGFEVHSDDPRFLRHSGHRLITLRRLNEAVSDLARASDMIRGQPDRVEPDGLPNDRGIPTSTLQSNIWYHLGLAHYLLGDFEAALEAFRECLAVSKNPDGVVSASHWLYATLRRLSRDEEAARVLEPITEDMDIIENQAYHDLLLLYKGLRTPEELIGPALAEASASGPATAYGVGAWYLYNGQRDQAFEIFRSILANGDQWAAFGYIGAEAEFWRSRTTP